MSKNSRDFQVNITGDSSKGRREFEHFQDTAVSVSKRVNKALDGIGKIAIGNILADGFSGAVSMAQDAATAAVDFVGGAIGKASDLNESVNAVNVSYGDSADEILALGDTSAETFGLAQKDLNAYAVQFSAFSKSIAGEGGDVAGAFESIMGRATDFASVMNLEVSDALQLFQSGLAGETEPLRKYGIDLSAAAVEAYALSSGIAETTVDQRKLGLEQNKLTRATEKYSQAVKDYGEDSIQASAARDAITQAEIGLEKAMEGSTTELTEAQKQQARYQYLLAQTDQVQGDFANTSDELANKNRINAAEWENIQTEIGQNFLPIAGELARVMNETVLPALSDVADEAGPKLQAAFEEAKPAIEDGIGALVDQLPELVEMGTEALPSIVEALGALPGIIEKVGPVFETLAGIMGPAVDLLYNGANAWGFVTGETVRTADGKYVDKDEYEAQQAEKEQAQQDQIAKSKQSWTAHNGQFELYDLVTGSNTSGGAEPPHLATGGVTTGETLAWIGDNPGGREVVQPLASLRSDRRDDIEAAVDLALARAGATGGGGANIHQVITAPPEVDVVQFADLVADKTEHALAVAG